MAWSIKSKWVFVCNDKKFLQQKMHQLVTHLITALHSFGALKLLWPKIQLRHTKTISQFIFTIRNQCVVPQQNQETPSIALAPVNGLPTCSTSNQQSTKEILHPRGARLRIFKVQTGKMEVTAVADAKRMAMSPVTPPCAKETIRDLLNMGKISVTETPCDSTEERNQNKRSNIASAQTLSTSGILDVTTPASSVLESLQRKSAYLRKRLNMNKAMSSFRPSASSSSKFLSEARRKVMFGVKPSPSRGPQTPLRTDSNLDDHSPFPSFDSSFSTSDDTMNSSSHATEPRNRKQLAVYSQQLQMRKIELQAQARIKAAEADFVAKRSKMQQQLHTETVAGIACSFGLFTPEICDLPLFPIHNYCNSLLILQWLSLLLKSASGPTRCNLWNLKCTRGILTVRNCVCRLKICSDMRSTMSRWCTNLVR